MLLGATVDRVQERSTDPLGSGRLRQHSAVVVPLERLELTTLN